MNLKKLLTAFVLSFFGMSALAQENKQGWSGSMDLNYGLPDEAIGALNLQYIKSIWTFDFAYDGHYSPNTIEGYLYREISDSGMKLRQDYVSEQLSTLHNARMLISAKPSAKELFALYVNTDFSKLTNDWNMASTQTVGGETRAFNRRNETTFSRKVAEGSFSYKRIFEKNVHELSLDAAFSRTKGDRPSRYFADDQLTQRSSGGGAPTNATLQADYLKAVGNQGRIEAGVKAFKRWNDFRYDFDEYDETNGQWMPNRLFSNDWEHDEHILAAYLMYGGKWSERWTYKAGARMEYSTSTLLQKSIGERIEKDFWHPFPFLSLQYRASEKHQFDFSYNRRITRPTYPQLNPIVYVVDHTFHETGNKDLNPELTDKFELSYTYHKEDGHFRAGIYFSSTDDYITQVTHLASPENLAMTYANGGRDRQVGVTLDFGSQLFPWLSMTRDLTVFYTRTTGIYKGMSLHSEDVAFTTSSTITANLGKKTDVEVFMNLTSAVDRPQFKFRPVAFGDVSVKHRFLGGRLTASLTLTDVINSDKWRAFSRIEPFKLRNYSKEATQTWLVGLTYNFNSFKMNNRMKPKQQEEGGNSIRMGQ